MKEGLLPLLNWTLAQNTWTAIHSDNVQEENKSRLSSSLFYNNHDVGDDVDQWEAKRRSEATAVAAGCGCSVTHRSTQTQNI